MDKAANQAFLIKKMEEKKTIRSRIAPTPSGYLHRGNAFSFLLTWLVVRTQGGELGLRIDDLDTARMRPEYLDDIFYSLDWLKLDYDFGPESPKEFHDTYSQQLRLKRYHELLTELKEKNLLFACRCSRKQIRESSMDGQYPGTCHKLELPFEQAETAWRIRTPKHSVLIENELKDSLEVSLHSKMRDFVVRRKDHIPAYQIASLADDTDQRINCIIRGADLIESSAAQLFLARQLTLRDFQKATFYHHPLVTDASGNKLSKSEGADALRTLRLSGHSPVEIYRQLASWLKLPSKEIYTLSDLKEAFTMEALPKIDYKPYT